MVGNGAINKLYHIYCSCKSNSDISLSLPELSYCVFKQCIYNDIYCKCYSSVSWIVLLIFLHLTLVLPAGIINMFIIGASSLKKLPRSPKRITGNCMQWEAPSSSINPKSLILWPHTSTPQPSTAVTHRLLIATNLTTSVGRSAWFTASKTWTCLT